MAHSKITFTHPTFNTVKIAPVGYDWLILLIGPISPFLRSDFKWAAVVLISTFVVGAIIPVFGVWISWGVFGAVYNKMYIKELLEKGYQMTFIESQFTSEQLQGMLELKIIDS